MNDLNPISNENLEKITKLIIDNDLKTVISGLFIILFGVLVFFIIKGFNKILDKMIERQEGTENQITKIETNVNDVKNTQNKLIEGIDKIADETKLNGEIMREVLKLNRDIIQKNTEVIQNNTEAFKMNKDVVIQLKEEQDKTINAVMKDNKQLRDEMWEHLRK